MELQQARECRKSSAYNILSSGKLEHLALSLAETLFITVLATI